MDNNYRFLIVFIDVLIPFFIGMWLKKNGFSHEWMRCIIRLNVVAVTTVLSVISFWELKITPELLWLPVSVIFICFIPAVFVFLFDRHRFSDPREQGSYLIVQMMGNIGTLGGLCAYVLYGEQGFAYMQMIGMPQVIVIVLFCFPAAQYYYDMWKYGNADRKRGFNLFQALFTWNQLPVVGIAAGILLAEGEVPKPAAVSLLFSALIHVNAWLGTIPVGYGINIGGTKKYYRHIWKTVPIKFILLPAVLWGMTRLITDDQMILSCVVLSAGVPAALCSVVAAQLYRLNVDLTEAGFLLTTGIFLFLIYPLFWWYVTFGGTF